MTADRETILNEAATAAGLFNRKGCWYVSNNCRVAISASFLRETFEVNELGTGNTQEFENVNDAIEYAKSL